MSNSKQLTRHAATKEPIPLSEDHQLILDCLSVASNLAAGHAAFKASPPEDSVHVERYANRHFKMARRCLDRVNSTKPKTISGLIAQARLVPMLLDDDCGGIEESTETFIRAFAANVCAHGSDN